MAPRPPLRTALSPRNVISPPPHEKFHNEALDLTTLLQVVREELRTSAPPVPPPLPPSPTPPLLPPPPSPLPVLAGSRSLAASAVDPNADHTVEAEAAVLRRLVEAATAEADAAKAMVSGLQGQVGVLLPHGLGPCSLQRERERERLLNPPPKYELS